MVIAMKCVVHGRVQGVFFRATAASMAEELGISGSAVNLPNGDVEVIVAGEEEPVNTFLRWLHVGPRQASVTSLTCEVHAGQVPSGFSIG